MKTLAELVGETLDMQATHGEQVAGIVGAVQEWLSQPEIGDFIERAGATSAGERALLAEVGRGLDA